MEHQATKIAIFGWTNSVHLTRWAKGLVDRGYAVKVISPVKAKIDGVDSSSFPGTGAMSYLRHASAAAEEAAAFKPDIVHVHYAGGLGLWGLRAGIKPMIVSVWGSDIVQLPSNPVYRWLIRRVLRQATRVTATSKMLLDTATNLEPSIRGRASVIPFGVNLPDSCFPPPNTRPVQICFTKSHRLVAGPMVLLHAMTQVVKEVPDIILNMAGAGPDTELIQKTIDDLGLRDNVRVVGYIENDFIYPFYRKHHITVMPSLEEGFGVAALEAAACGRPVVASDAGGIPEVLVDNKTGIMVPAGEVDSLAAAIVRLARDAAMRERMGREGYNFVRENFTWDRSLDMMTDLYKQVLHERS